MTWASPDVVFCHPEQYKELLWSADMLAYGNLPRWKRWITKCPCITDKKYQDAVNALETDDSDFANCAKRIMNTQLKVYAPADKYCKICHGTGDLWQGDSVSHEPIPCTCITRAEKDE